MRLLKTEEFFYVGGGDDGDGSDGSGHDGYAGTDASYTASISDKNACIARCSATTLPTGDFGTSFWRCMNACYSPLGSYNPNPYGPGGIYTISQGD
jgi:hypothetical protein